MGRTMVVSESVVIRADPQAVYALVADPTLTGGWSPENLGARVKQAGDALQLVGGPLPVGAVFTGRNQRFRFRWTTECVVTHADPGKEFTFQVRSWGVRTPRLRVPIATWSYTLREVDGGTEVTETWTDDRSSWPDPVAGVVDRFLTGGSSFAAFNRGNIRTTLGNLKVAVEKL